MCTGTVTEKSDCIALGHLIVAMLGGIGAETCCECGLVVAVPVLSRVPSTVLYQWAPCLPVLPGVSVVSCSGSSDGHSLQGT